MDIKIIGKHIRQYRKIKGLTQEELAKNSGLSTMSIRRYESGERIASEKILSKIANALGVQLFDLIGYGGKFDLQYPDKKSEVSEYDGFITYLNTLGFTVKDSVAKWHDEPMTDENGEIVGYEKVEDESEFILTKDKYSATFTETEFKALQNGTRESVEGVFFRKVVESKKK